MMNKEENEATEAIVKVAEALVKTTDVSHMQKITTHHNSVSTDAVELLSQALR